jgi:hypothetical protein
MPDLYVFKRRATEEDLPDQGLRSNMLYEYIRCTAPEAN